MTIITIILGLLGLGIVVFFHELGHFLAARLVGVEVEEFSLGWGPRLLSYKAPKTKYTLSAFPIGGYCRMKGETAYKKALEEGLDDFPKESGSFFSASPLKRIIIAFGGPAMNVVFAAMVYVLIMSTGFTYQSWDNKILLASSVSGTSYPADLAGLKSGDVITSIGSKTVSTFSDIQEAITLSAGKTMPLTVSRNGQTYVLSITPDLDKDSGAGRIGIFPWIATVVKAVNPNGAAALAGLKSGDVIEKVNNKDVSNTMELLSILQSDKPVKAVFGFKRDGRYMEASCVLTYEDTGNVDLGIGWKTVESKIQAANFSEAISMGVSETGKTISATYKGLASLFKGVNVLKAVSGPARITWMVGSIAKDGLEAPDTIFQALSFLAMLSIGLFAMNLLPIPLLDGGSIVLYLVEIIRRKAVKVKTVMRYQTIGVIAVAMLFLLSTISDFIFFTKK